MTRSEFIEEAKTFSPGIMVIVSGKRSDDVKALLEEARTAIESVSKQALVYDSRDTMIYSQRGDQEDVEEGMLFEFVKVISDGFIVLVGNEFDRDDTSQNSKKRTVEIDVVLDIMDPFKVTGIPRAYSRNIGTTREIWPFMDKLYWFDVDTDEVTFVKFLDSFR
jgi:hypothetical protein